MDEAPAKLGNEPGIRLAPVVQQHLDKIYVLQQYKIISQYMFAALPSCLWIDGCSVTGFVKGRWLQHQAGNTLAE